MHEPDPALSAFNVGELRRQLGTQYHRGGTQPWPIEACVVREGDKEACSAVIKIDTQSSQSWVSSDLLVRRGNDQSKVCSCEDEGYYEGFFGETVQPTGIVSLAWYAKNVGKTRQTDFLINPRSTSFDLLVGDEFLLEEGFATLFREPISAIRDMKLTDCKRRMLYASDAVADTFQRRQRRCRPTYTSGMPQARRSVP